MKVITILVLFALIVFSCEKKDDTYDSTSPYYPKYSLNSDTYSEDISLIIFSDNNDVNIYYTTDGTDPDAKSMKYEQPIIIAGDQTSVYIKAIAIHPKDLEPSIITSSYYKIDFNCLPGIFIDSIDLDTYNEKIVGKWIGYVTTPWINPYNVQLEIFSDGNYSAHSLSPYKYPQSSTIEYPAFYYGTDSDSELKKIQLDSIDQDGFASGEISILFYDDGIELDSLRGLRFSNDFNIMKFEIWHNILYGPLEYKFTRVEKLF